MNYLVYFESANYAGCGEYILVDADNAQQAEDYISSYAEEAYYEQDSSQLEEDENDTDVYSLVISVEEFDESHELWILRATFNRYVTGD